MAMLIGQAVKSSRRELGLSSTTLAQQAGVSEDDLADLEDGHRSLTASALMRLARAMGLAPTVFLTDAGARTAKPVLDRAKFFHATDAPVLSEADVVAIAREVTRAQVFAELAGPRVHLDDYAPTKPGGKPWRNGYDLATTLRLQLGLVSEPIPSVQRLLEDEFGILVAKHAFADSKLRAVAVRAPQGRLIMVSKRLPTALFRISLAHELCHHACDLHPNESLGETDEVSLEGFSGTEPGKEQRAKAFAVMFLAPSALVRELLGPPIHQFATAPKALGAASRLAVRCGMGIAASLWHLFHLKYLTDSEDDVQVWQRHVPSEALLTGFEPSFGDQDGLSRAIDAALVAEEIDADQAERLRSL